MFDYEKEDKMALKQSLIENNSILLQAKADNWQDAIKLGTDMLIASKAIEPSYHEAIINSIKKSGPYIIIAPNFAMPHARPEDGVNHTAFALVTLQSPVYFDGEEEPVDVLVTLAGSSSDQHLEGLVEVTKILEDDNCESGINLDPLRKCRTKEDVYTVIDNALAEN